jgi:hypothetical protein
MQIYLSCDPDYFEGQTEIAVTIPKKTTKIKIKGGPTVKIPITIAEQVDDAIREWYAALGSPVPENEIGIGELMAAIDKAEEDRVEAARTKAEEEVPSAVPSYGTPEFWAYHRAKKAAENKRREEAGLPSVDEEKAQKAAAKATKAAAKAKKTS